MRVLLRSDGDARSGAAVGFVERVLNTLSACAEIYEPGPGDIDRAIRQALVGPAAGAAAPRGQPSIAVEAPDVGVRSGQADGVGQPSAYAPGALSPNDCDASG